MMHAGAHRIYVFQVAEGRQLHIYIGQLFRRLRGISAPPSNSVQRLTRTKASWRLSCLYFFWTSLRPAFSLAHGVSESPG
eukprot:401118-Pleurochrysis_carterae.AAC.1